MINMQNSGFISSDIDFNSSQVSQLSNFNFQLKNTNNFETDQTVIINTISDVSDSVKDFNESTHINDNHLSKKLYIKDLQVSKEKPQKFKVSNKENNIPNQATNQSYTQSRKIIIHKNPSNISPYRNPRAVDESFTTNKIVQLQEELISMRKEMGLKESNWIKEKSMLMSKMEMASLQMAEMKQRNNNLIQINQTLTQALGQTAKNEVIGEYEKKIEETNKQLAEKNKKILKLQQSFARIEKQKMDQNSRQKQDKEKIEYLGKTVEEYKLLVKESNERKFDSDEKMVIISRSIEVIRIKLNELPIKNEYLLPIFSLLDSLVENTHNNQQMKVNYDYQQVRAKNENKNKGQANPNERSFIRGLSRQNIQSLDISQIQKPFEICQPYQNNHIYRENKKKPKQITNKSQTNNYKEQQSFINQLNDMSNTQFDHEEFSSNSHFFTYENSNDHKQYRDIQGYQRNNQNIQRNASFYKNNEDEHIYYESCNPHQIRRKNTFHNLLLDQQKVKRIDTSQDQYEEYQTRNRNHPHPNRKTPYRNTNNDILYIQPQDQQQVYLCEVCHRVYPHQQFLNHMKQCQEYQALLQQKKLIESKLISINQIDYQNRKSNHNSLNSSAIILNKSRSKTKVPKPIEQPVLIGKPSHNQHPRQQKQVRQTHQINQRGDYTNRRENLTERYIYRDQNDGFQMSQLMDISGISSRPSNMNQNKEHRQPKGGLQRMISPNKYFTSQNTQKNYNQNYQTQHQIQEDSGFFNNSNLQKNKYKGNPQIKYQTNTQERNNVGKESMQEEIRKIVEAINEGKSSKTRPDSFSAKVTNHHQRIESNRKEFVFKTKSKAEFY